MTLVGEILHLPVRIFRRLLREIGGSFARLGSHNPIFAKVYYGCGNEFGREQVAFLAGRRRYLHSLSAPCGTMAMLRRNVHRIEKGLLMRPRRIPFAMDFIAETVEAFLAGSNASDTLDPAEQGWAGDVLAEYFSLHANERGVELLAKKFRSAGGAPYEEAGRRIPYRRDLASAPPVSYDALMKLAQRRRSVRWFLQQPVERRLIDQALELAVQAPSACNRQPFEFRIFDDPALVRKVIDVPYGLAGYGHNVPVVIVVVGQQRHFFSERDRHLIYIDASLAVMGFALALETLSLSSCCVNWPDLADREAKMAKLLGLASDERPIMLVALGYPDPEGMVACSTKKSLQQLRHYNFE